MNHGNSFDNLTKHFAAGMPRRGFVRWVVGFLGGTMLVTFGAPKRAFGKVLYDFADLKRAGHPVGNNGSICFYIAPVSALVGKPVAELTHFAVVPNLGGTEPRNERMTVVIQMGLMKCVYPDNRVHDGVAFCTPNDDGSQRPANLCLEDAVVQTYDRSEFDNKFGRVVVKGAVLVESAKSSEASSSPK
jgi:hypothetical protein